MANLKVKRRFPKTHKFFENKIGYIYLILMIFTSGITTVLIKYLMIGGLNPFHILTYTSFLGILIMVIISSRDGTQSFIKSDIGLGWLIIAAVSGFSLYEISFNMSLQYMTVSQTIIIYYTHPIFLYFAGILFLQKGKRKVDRRVLLGILISFSGIYFVLTGGKSLSINVNIGLLFIFISIISITIFTILGKLKEIPEKQFLIMGQAIALASGIIVLTVNGWWVIPDQAELMYLIFIAIVYNLINMLFYVKTIQHLSVEKLSTLTYLSPVITSILAVLILKEPIFASTAIGLLMVIFGNIISGAKET